MVLTLVAFGIGLTALASAAGLLALPSPLANLDASLPLVFRIHMATGGAGFLLAPLVLSLRRRPRWHRPLGRIAAALLLTSAAAGLPAALLSEATPAARLGFLVQGALCAGCLVMAWRAIRAQEVARHARWMVLALALLSGVIWLRLLLGAAVVLQLPFDAAYAVAAWVAWLVPTALTVAVQAQGAAARPRSLESALRPMDQFSAIRTSGFGTVQQAPPASRNTTHIRCASGP